MGRGAVRGVGWEPDQAPVPRHIDDSPATGIQYGGYLALHTAPYTVQLGIDHFRPVLFSFISSLFPGACQSRIIEGYIQSTEFSDSPVYRILQGAQTTDIRLHEQTVAIHRFNGTHHLVAVVRVAATDHHVGAFLRKAQGRSPADAAGAAQHQHRFVLKPFNHYTHTGSSFIPNSQFLIIM